MQAPVTRRVRYRRLPKIPIQAYMNAITQNLKRLESHLFGPFYSCVFRIVTKMQTSTATRTIQIHFYQMSMHSL